MARDLVGMPQDYARISHAFSCYRCGHSWHGGSSKSQDGYDKKTMAKDIYALVSQRGFKKVNIVGHDIGSMVGFAFAANYPDAIQKLALLDAPHPNESTMKRPMFPEVGKFGTKIDEDHPMYPWWFAFHQVKGLPEKLLAGREGI